MHCVVPGDFLLLMLARAQRKSNCFAAMESIYLAL